MRAGTGWLRPAGIALALVGCAAPRPQLTAVTALQSEYQRAIRDASVRHPDWSVPLWTFGNAATALVSTFTDDPALDTVTQVNWVAATAEVRPRCKGKAGVVLFLEELLGLPPVDPGPGKRWHVYTFEVARESFFRPCPGGVDQSVPSAPRCIAGSAIDHDLDPDTARFLLQQFWFSHRTPMVGSENTDFGFPWTGMGWTYNWDPHSRTHVGVSEFVVQQGAVAHDIRDETPAQFCAARP